MSKLLLGATVALALIAQEPVKDVPVREKDWRDVLSQLDQCDSAASRLPQDMRLRERFIRNCVSDAYRGLGPGLSRESAFRNELRSLCTRSGGSATLCGSIF